MKYCYECGYPLIKKELKNEGMIPFCENCQDYKFEIFNSAISTVILNPKKNKVLLIKQYGRDDYILVAGYINKGENAIEALKREVKEEVNLNVSSYLYNENAYYAKSNTLIHNYISVVKNENFKLNEEVDYAKWINIEDVPLHIKPKSYAENFFKASIHKIKTSL